MTIKVLVVDDQRLIREGIASLLNLDPEITVVGTAEDGQSAITQTQALSPDIILMDVRMPVMDGIQATKELHKHPEHPKILMLTTFNDEALVIQALRAGANGYLLKDLPASELAQAIKLTQAGIDQYSPQATTHLRAALTPQPQNPLTQREQEVLHLIATGATNQEIAQQLYITEGTVKNHVSNILTRLSLKDRTQAAIYAHTHNLL